MTSSTARTQIDLVMLLGGFVQMVSSQATIDPSNIEFCRIIQELCEKAPKAAQAIAEAIQDNGHFGTSLDVATDATGVASLKGRKRKSSGDPAFCRLAKRSAGSFPACPSHSGEKTSCDELAGSSRVSKPLQEESVLTNEISLQNSSKWGTAITTSEAVETRLDKSDQTETEHLSEEGPPSPVAVKSEPDALTRWIKEPYSPRTEEISRDKIPGSLVSLTSPQQATPESFALEGQSIQSIRDLIIQAVQTIYGLSTHRDNIPRDLHKRILQSLRGTCPEAIAASPCTQWSDGSIWKRVLEIGTSRQNEVTILNMLEYMGAWQWYNSQVELAEQKTQTKKNKQVQRRGAAIHVLDRIQKESMRATEMGSWISGVGKVTLEQDESGFLSTSRHDSITTRQKNLQRRHIRMQLSRGKLSTQLVEGLGLGILFDRNIWKYTKMSKARIDTMIKWIQEDSEHMQLLEILTPQLECLVEDGSPDLEVFYKDLKITKLVTEDELRQLQIDFPLKSRSLPDGTLNAAIDHLVERVSTKVFNKAVPESGDTVAINGSMELSCEIFKRLHPGNWLDSWTIMALMQISDRPAFVKYDLSIPLDDTGSDSQIRPIKRPLACWAKKIAQHRREAKKIFGDALSLVYFCPINHKNKHFTLLEVNEREKAIRHYDSMADSDTILGVKATRLAKLVKEEFGTLKFSYSEMKSTITGAAASGLSGISDGWQIIYQLEHRVQY
ncbi:hypothetical protein BDV12DRAFT_196550 [Aspergillus spectabilis]